MFWLVMTMANMDITIAIFDVAADEELFADGFTMPAIESIVVLAKPLSQWRLDAIDDRTFGGLAIGLFDAARITMMVPAFVMHAAHALTYAWTPAIIDLAECFLFSHTCILTLGMCECNR